MIQLEQAEGEFVLPTPMPRKLLLVTAGSGITPVIGMLRNLFRRAGCRWTPTSRRARRPERVLGDLPRRAASAPPRGASRWSSGTTTATASSTSPTSTSWSPTWASGTPTPAGRRGCSTPSRSTTPTAACSLTTERFRPVLVEPGEGGSVTFADGREVEADGATPILDVAEAAGVLMPSGCRMGICLGCVIPMRSGAVRDLRNGAITTAIPGETGPEGVPIQTCINAAAGECAPRPKEYADDHDHEEARQPDRPPHPRGHRADRLRARRHPPGRPRHPRRAATRRTSAG